MYKYSPRHKNLVYPALFCVLSVVFAVTWLAPIDNIEAIAPFITSIRIGGLTAISAAVYLAVRYCFVKYVYELEADPLCEGALLLTVTELRGKKALTVCRISTDDIAVFEPLRRRRLRKFWKRGNKPRGARIYSYCADLLPRAYIAVLREDAPSRTSDADSEAVLFSPDEKMARLITQAIRQRRGDS